MSRRTPCPNPKCKGGTVTEHTDFGHIQGRHLFQCRECKTYWEAVEGQRLIRANDPILTAL